jgi:hypothetical protein
LKKGKKSIPEDKYEEIKGQLKKLILDNMPNLAPHFPSEVLKVEPEADFEVTEKLVTFCYSMP